MRITGLLLFLLGFAVSYTILGSWFGYIAVLQILGVIGSFLALVIGVSLMN